MGGSYNDYGSSSYCYSRSGSVDGTNISIGKLFSSYKSTKDTSKLIQAYNKFMESNTSGFIKKLSELAGISSIENIPKEFADIEYEVKFSIGYDGKADSEPSIKQYLDAMDFPATQSARFIKDSIHTVSEGTNHFFGENLEEKLVIIEKLGKKYIKEKGPILSIDCDVEGKQYIVKRTEKRYEATMDEIITKMQENMKQNAEYKGRIRKEKGDDFILDLYDGRIYSFTITRAHLLTPGDTNETAVQRQLEIEYAGYIPGFVNFKKNSEAQIIEGMVELAKKTWTLHNQMLINNQLACIYPTSQRKYDFVNQRLEEKKADLLLEGKHIPLQEKVRVR